MYAVEDFLNKLPAFETRSTAEIVEYLAEDFPNVPAGTVRQGLSRMVADGRLVSPDRTLYRVPIRELKLTPLSALTRSGTSVRSSSNQPESES